MENTELKSIIMEKAEQNEDFAKEFVSAENAGALVAVLRENGIEATEEQIMALFADGAHNYEEYSNAELSEEQLDEVAGGKFWRGTGRLVVSCGVAFGYGCLCGVCPALSAGAPYVAGTLSVWTAAGYLKK